MHDTAVMCVLQSRSVQAEVLGKLRTTAEPACNISVPPEIICTKLWAGLSSDMHSGR